LGRTTTSPLLEAYFQRRPALKRFFQARFGAASVEADDLMQDLYLKLAEQEGDSAIANPGAYLYRLAHNLTLDRMRANRRALTRDGDWRLAHHGIADREDVADLPGAEAALGARQRLDRLVAAVDSLPPQTARVFRLHKFEGLSYAETAARLGISRSAVEKHMTTALRRLLKQVGE
jgi:RNA polymerase sigma-70 factor (ECF subfamily)